MYRTNATPERLGWKAHIEEVRRNVDGVIHSKTLPGFFPSKEAAAAAAQEWITAKENPAKSQERREVEAKAARARAADAEGSIAAHTPEKPETVSARRTSARAGGEE